MGDVSLRPATPTDVPLLMVAVNAAERVQTGDPVSTYEKIFNLTSDEWTTMLPLILEQQGQGHQLTYATFHILEVDGRAAACCSAWIEGEGSSASGFRTASVLMPRIGLSRWKASRINVKAVAEAAPARTPGALQLETFYTEPAFRGRGLTAQLIERVLSAMTAGGGIGGSAEITLLDTNRAARRAYEKAEFSLRWSTPAEVPAFRVLIGAGGFIQLRRVLTPAAG